MCNKCIIVLALLLIAGIAIWFVVSKKPILSTKKTQCDPNKAPQVTKGTNVNCVNGQWVIEPN